MLRQPPKSTLFPYPPLFRSRGHALLRQTVEGPLGRAPHAAGGLVGGERREHRHRRRAEEAARGVRRAAKRDRKSTRLNSSHVRISYAVFCLKKKKHR